MTEWLRQWAGGICAGCMLAGAVQLLLPRSRHTPVIKNIVVLYIVLAILSPASSDEKLFAFTDRAEIQPAPVYDTAALQARQTEIVLENTFTEKLAAQGVQARVDVRLGEDGADGIAVQALVATEAQCRLAQVLMEEWVGEGGTVECQAQ